MIVAGSNIHICDGLDCGTGNSCGISYRGEPYCRCPGDDKPQISMRTTCAINGMEVDYVHSFIYAHKNTCNTLLNYVLTNTQLSVLLP